MSVGFEVISEGGQLGETQPVGFFGTLSHRKTGKTTIYGPESITA